MLQILAHLGAQVERASGTVTVTAEKIHCVAPYDGRPEMRASVCVLGPLLGSARKPASRCRAAVSLAIGQLICILKGFEALGSAVRVEGGDYQGFCA